MASSASGTVESAIRKPCVLVVNWRCIHNPRAGGAETHLHEISKQLIRRGWNIHVLTNGWPDAARREVVDGVRYHRVGGEISFLWKHRAAFRTLCRNYGFDLIVDDISKVPLGLGRVTDIPTVAWCHHIHGPMLYRQLPYGAARIIDWCEHRIPRWYAETPILAVSGSTRQELIGLGVPRTRISYVHNGVDARRVRAHGAPKSAKPLLVYLGRLQRYKNVDCVLRAFARIRSTAPDAELLILGGGADEKRLQRLARRVCPAGVTFRGRVSEAEKHEMLHRAWLLLASSMKEGWGICILEANAAGTPVVASDVPGHRDAVIHGETGYLYPYDDDQALAETVLRCVGEPERLAALSQVATAWADRFTWERSADEFIQWAAHFYPHLGTGSRPHLAERRSTGVGIPTPANPPDVIAACPVSSPRR